MRFKNIMKALVLSSGGIDSTTCLSLAIKTYGKEQVLSLPITYGQKHKKELEAANQVAAYYGVEHITLDLTPMFSFSDCSLLSHSEKEIPKESYAMQLQKAKGKPVSTYVPFRNGLFLSSAAAIAISKGCEVIYYGAHHDDAAGNAYPDCSTEFNNAINTAIFEGSGHQVRIEAPFLSMSKKEIVKFGLKLHAPYHMTWSCYEGGEKPCGVCGTCLDRKAAFLANNIEDPAIF